MLGIQYEVIIAYLIALVLLYVVGWLLLAPLKILFKLVLNGVIGGVLLLAINWVGAYIGLHVPLNVLSALAAGFLGVPGVIMLIGLQWILF